MNKNDLITVLAETTSLSKAKATEVLDAVLNIITKALKKKEEVKLIGFGPFAVAKRKPSKGHNPRTG